MSKRSARGDAKIAAEFDEAQERKKKEREEEKRIREAKKEVAEKK